MLNNFQYNFQFFVRPFAGLVTEISTLEPTVGFYELQRAIDYAEFMHQTDKRNFIVVFDVNGKSVGCVTPGGGGNYSGRIN